MIFFDYKNWKKSRQARRSKLVAPRYSIWLLLGTVLSLVSISVVAVDEPIQPLPTITLDARKVALGERLFLDPRLSKDDTVSCSSCHGLDRGGVDGAGVSTGVGGAKGQVNSPTVYNSGLNFRQFWDGRAGSLEDQIEGPIHADAEMATNWRDIIAKLSKDEDYQARFAALYADGIQSETIKDAIATFERSLLTPSRFDDYLRGDNTALTDDEVHGYQLFKNYGCVACHQGTNIGGNMFQYFGVMGNYFKDRGNITEADYGRYNVTGNEYDRFMFKVPSLRNIALTAPYFHDGSAQTLDDAVATMIKYQLGRMIPDQDRALIVGFLHALTGKKESEIGQVAGSRREQKTGEGS